MDPTPTLVPHPEHPERRFDGRAFVRLSLHDTVVADDVYPAAAELRDELLLFPDWEPMRLGLHYGFQTALTTSSLEGRRPELVRCHAFEDWLVGRGESLRELVRAAPGGALRPNYSGMAYGEGGRLRLHTDSIEDRVLAWVLYLTHPDDGEWSEADGGALLLHDGAGSTCRVPPRFNRLIAFRVSDAALHEIEEIRRPTPWERSRLALSGWLYTS